jgi:hypothetical protein
MNEVKVGDLVSFKGNRDCEITTEFDLRKDIGPMIVIKNIDSSEIGHLVEVFYNNKTFVYPTYLLEKLT